MLKKIFIELCSRHTNNVSLAGNLWSEIERAYSHQKRFYHNFTHLENIIASLDQVKSQINNWDTILFSVFYHDIVYNPIKKNNEEVSAVLAVKRLTAFGVDDKIIDGCRVQILATKSHQFCNDADVNIFTDADLAIIGSDWDTYNIYLANIRKEYNVFPDIICKPGRKKVLTHFLSMKRIYKTNYFFEKLEKKAKENLTKELELLS